MKNLSTPYLIAETAYNHEGDFDYMIKMIDEIAEIEANAVKFHLLLKLNSYFQNKHPLIKTAENWLFSEDQWHKIIDHSLTQKLDVVALCDDVESLEFINNHYPDIFAIELHASGLNDYFLLKEALHFKGTIILGVGGSTLDEVQYAVNFLRSNGKSDILLMYGFQSYPTDYQMINLAKMSRLKNLFDLPVGYADHTAFDDPNNEFISVLAAAMGFNVLEKHYTPDWGKERIDHHAAVGFEQLKKIKELLELTLTVRGSGDIEMSDPERVYGNTGPMKKAIVAKRKINKGEKLDSSNLWFKRTEEQSPIKQLMFHQLIGLEALKDIEEDEVIDFSKVKYEFQKLSTEDLTKVKKR